MSIQSSEFLVETIAVIGLGYVGLPLAVALQEHVNVIGYDIDEDRIRELKDGYDRTRECSAEELNALEDLTFSTKVKDLQSADVYIVTVPTPIDDLNTPDLSILQSASHTIGTSLRPGNTVIYESTVYPGATEEVCVPVLEHISGLTFNKDFFVGYSPERINPGDKKNTLKTITKLVSGSNSDVTDLAMVIYSKVVDAPLHPVSSIKVAEAAKVIENTQRDVNIALINEFSVIFSAIGIDTQEVLDAAATKWNFMRFSPGLVGGHCIGVDPHYLAHKARSIGVEPEIILAARNRSAKMGAYIAEQLLRQLILAKSDFSKLRVLIMGYTFKENCPDTRNSRVVDIINQLRHQNITTDIYDPVIDPQEAEKLQVMQKTPEANQYDAVIVAVSHKEFLDLGIDTIKNLTKDARGIVFDIKGSFPADRTNFRL